MNLNSINYKRGRKMHKLSNINNKSSDSINPDNFNPLINYKNEDKNKNKIIRRNNLTNQDHFDHMIPTQSYIYKPHTKKSMYSYYLKSQIDNLPGKRPSRIEKTPNRKTGKKTFNNSYLEETKDNSSRNLLNNQLKNKRNTNIATNNRNYSKVYEFDNPIIYHREMK